MSRNNIRSQPPCNIYIVAPGSGGAQPRPVAGLGAVQSAAPAMWTPAAHSGPVGYDPLPPTPVCTTLPNGTRRCCITSPYDNSVHCVVMPPDNGGDDGDNTGYGPRAPTRGFGAAPLPVPPRPSQARCGETPGGMTECCKTLPSGAESCCVIRPPRPVGPGGGGYDPVGPGGGENGGGRGDDPSGGGGVEGASYGLGSTRYFGAAPAPHPTPAAFDCTFAGRTPEGDIMLSCRPQWSGGHVGFR